ncbi:mRNA decapping hydrolase [Pseudovirgaria hyperparasitica]|uniref:mRNA decapping hydrolase n=1 Tax=Pseudovirgaria hyperparasitica TaxID=470096 RepID=A0A6A6VT45_9PEZI|nr:mRNA decapping hydrolase [Pseudovirgaria hyperparasitica]KAF2753848.1 mRNA decapping hydrolase [Pseudovirgaria hyperparasitica]
MKESAPAKAEALIPQFVFERLLNQDQGGRRISLLGKINSEPALLIVERAAFSVEDAHLRNLSSSLSRIQNLGANDIYNWFMASSASASPDTSSQQPQDLKINLIYPCTPKHVQKYSSQEVRVVTETPEIYTKYVRPYAQRMREEGRLNWVFNIIDGMAEQEDVMYRESGTEEGFLLAPDLNWDRKTLTSLHLLCLIERRDIWSIRDLRKSHVPWLKHMRDKLLASTTKLYPAIDADQIKLYFHYQPTYYHLHVHIVHAAFDAGATQSVGKALGLEHVISQLETLDSGVNADGNEASLADVDLTYTLGERSELWEKVFMPLKSGGLPDIGT